MSKLNVVVVGGGGAGANVVRTLSAKLDPARYNLLLISSRQHYIHYPAVPRMAVTHEGKLEDRALIPYDNLFKNGTGKLKVGTVTAVHPTNLPGQKGGGAVELEGGENIPYEYLVLASGSLWEGPVKFPNGTPDIIDSIKSWRKQFAGADDIVVAGGGAVGIELCGELRDVYPTKRITIVHAGRLLLNETYPDRFRRDMESRLRARDINVILNDRIEGQEVDASGLVRTVNGVDLKADLIVPARGGRPNTGFLRTLPGDVLTPTGHVKIRPTLQLEAYPNIFSAGDIIDFAEQKQVAKAPSHASVVSSNILSLLADKDPTSQYKGFLEAIAVTNGKGGGAMYVNILWGLMFGNFVVRMIKAKELFVSGTRKNLGASA